MSEDYQKFTKPKPMAFAFKVDVRPDNFFDIETDFSETFGEKLSDVQKLHNEKQAKKNPNASAADIRAARDLSLIGSGLKFLSKEQRVKMELAESRFNFERVKEEDYLDSDELIKKMEKNKIDFESEAAKAELLKNSTAETQFQGEKNTYLHNADLYQSLHDRNPFKKGDKRNNQSFDKDEKYAAFNSQFLTPLNQLSSLKEDLFKEMNSVMEKISKNFKKFTLKDVPDPYFANNVEKNDINMDYQDIITSPEVFKTLEAKESFYTVLSAYEDMQRFHALFIDMYGSGPKSQLLKTKAPIKNIGMSNIDESFAVEETDAVKPLSDELGFEESLTESNFLEDEVFLEDVMTEEMMDEEIENAMKEAKAWWESIGENIDNPTKLLSAGMIPNIVESLADLMNWGNIGGKDGFSDNELLEYGDPRDVFVNGYIEYLAQNFLEQFQPNGKVTAEDLTYDSLSQGKEIFESLQREGYLTNTGQVSGRFPLNDPAFTLDLGLGIDEENRITKILREKALGRYSFEAQDTPEVGGKSRRNIEIYDDQTETYMSMQDILDLVTSGEGHKEKLGSVKTAYNLVLKLYANITGVDEENQSDGKVVTEDAGLGVKTKLFDYAKWSEWNSESSATEDKDGNITYTGAWESVESEALEITFKSEAEAQNFADKLLELSQLLAPVLGVFDRDELTVLSNNVISKESDNLITEESSEYKLQMVQINRYDSDVYKQAQTFIKSKVTSEIGIRVFEKSQINKLVYNRNEQQKKDWDKQKEEHDEEEYNRIKDEVKTRLKTDAARKREIQKAIARAKKAAQEMERNNKKNKSNNKKTKKS